MNRRSATLLLTLVLWPALFGVLKDSVVPTARHWGWALGQLYLLRAAPLIPDLPPPDEFEIPAEPSYEGADEPSPISRPKTPRVHRGIRVGKEAILRLARARAIPSSVPVPARWPRPPGLKLVDVGRFGLGVRNGDVLTKVMGIAALNRGAVIGAVVAARERRLPAVSAEFWRGNLRYQLYVEMPYPAESPASTSSGPGAFVP